MEVVNSMVKILLSLAVVIVVAESAKFGPKKLYKLDIPTDIVSVNVINYFGAEGKVARDLVIVGPWYIGQVQNVHWKFRQSSRMRPRVINKDIPNPRHVGKIPANAFSKTKGVTYWVASWGTNDTQGAMYVLQPTPNYSVWKDITVDHGWNYERSQWVDMNKDGRLDCLTARFRGGGKYVGQLLWFNQPPHNENWGQQIIHEGMADGNFVGFLKGGKTYILVAGLQFSTLGLYWTMNPKNNWAINRQVRHRVIDNYGKFYDVEYVDLNRDGRTDVLTTTVNIGNSRGHVLGYEVPNDLQNKIWKRRVLSAGFTGDYSPGKATAFWTNKNKRASERPSIFLSGAGAETIFVLTPTPKKTGWGYIRSSLKAGYGMIGIPYIGDLDGDSYPEIIVPQGKELHVFSYDYNAAVAEPPEPSKAPGAASNRKPVPYKNPFFRPTTAAPKPKRPVRNNTALSTGIRPGAAAGPAVGTGGEAPEAPTKSGSPATPVMSFVFPNGQVPSVGDVNGNAGGGNPSRPSSPRGGGGSATLGSGLGLNPSGNNNPPGNTNPSGGGSSSSSAPSFSLWPVMTDNGQVLIPVANSPPRNNANNGAPAGGSNTGGTSSATGGFPQFSNSGGAATGTNTETSNNNPQTSFNNNNIFTPRNTNNNVPSSNINPANLNPNIPNEPVPNSIIPFYQPQTPAPPIKTFFGPNQPPIQPAGNNQIIPFNGNQPSTARNTSNNIIPYNQNLNPALTDTFFQQQPSLPEPPPNLMLTVTDAEYAYKEEAADACSFENKVLCSLEQLSIARKSGPIPDVEWGWFDIEGRVAEVVDCIPGEIKWPGYECHNGVVGHAPVKQSSMFKGLCCAVLRGAVATERKFSNNYKAADYCKYNDSNTRLCTLEDLYKVWDMSSYKDDQWRFYDEANKLAKLVHRCDPDVSIWPGYACYGGGIVTSQINGNVQERALCCPNQSNKLTYNISILFLSILYAFFPSNL